MTIRFANSKDADRILEIYAPFIQQSPVSFETEVPTLEEFRKRMERIQAIYPWIVGEMDGQIVGYAYGSPHRGRRAYSWSTEVTVYMDQKFKRMGLGRKLYCRLFDLLRLQGFHLALGGVALPNEGSEGLHRSLGFSLVGVYKNVGFKHGQWHDVAWYQKQLQDTDSPKQILPIDDALNVAPRVSPVFAEDPRVQILIDELDTYLNALYPPEDNFLDSSETLQNTSGKMLGLYLGDLLIGIGAVKFFGDYAELKRMYLDPMFRGLGFSQTLLKELEIEASVNGLNTVRLETGRSQTSALKLYEGFGYKSTEPFGEYSSNPSSLFLEKTL